jgi:L-fuconolactonase
MRIDSHQHYWSLARGDYGWLTPELAPIYRDFGPDDLKPLLAKANIDRTILVQAAPTEAETRYLLDLARTESTIAGVVGWADFEGSDVTQRIAALADDRLLVGLRPMMQDIADPAWMLRPTVGIAIESMLSHGLVFDALVKPVHLRPLLTLAERHPQLSIVIDHGAKPDIALDTFSPWAEDMARLAERANTVAKLSGLVTEAGASWCEADLQRYIEHILATFGPARVLFGSDWPVLNLAGEYGGWLAIVVRAIAHLQPNEIAAVMGANARRIYLSKRGRI